jgi:hypothetical protein
MAIPTDLHPIRTLTTTTIMTTAIRMEDGRMRPLSLSTDLAVPMDMMRMTTDTEGIRMTRKSIAGTVTTIVKTTRMRMMIRTAVTTVIHMITDTDTIMAASMVTLTTIMVTLTATTMKLLHCTYLHATPRPVPSFLLLYLLCQPTCGLVQLILTMQIMFIPQPHFRQLRLPTPITVVLLKNTIKLAVKQMVTIMVMIMDRVIICVGYFCMSWQ